MPSNWLYIDTNFPAFTKDESTEEKVTSIQNYVYMLVEQMRWTLNHLDWSNFNQQELGKFQQLITEPLLARIEDDEGNLAQLALSAAGLASQVSNQAGQISLISQKADRIDWIVASGTSASNFTMTDRAIQLVSENINLDGYVTFTNLSQTGGATVINAGNIKTGTIAAVDLSLNGLLELEYGSVSYGYVGATTMGQTPGAALCDSGANNYVIATNTGVRISYGSTHEIWVQYDGCNATSTIRTGSDRRLKHDIIYDEEKYEAFFDALRPCSFIYNGQRRRTTGLIAQDVEAALARAGVMAEDFSGLACSEETGIYSLAYADFVPLCIAEIQRLKQRVKELEGRT